MGKYCAACGQKDEPMPPEFGHFLHEAAHAIFEVDGRIFRSLRLLIFSPGQLTIEYWSGRRSGQVPPLRLYIVSSAIIFGLITLLPNVKRVPFEPNMTVTSSDYDGGAPHNILDLPLERRKDVVSGMIKPESRWASFRAPLIKAVEDPLEFRRKLLENASKAMFVLLPLFAATTWLFFRRAGRVYLEQLTLALHVHTFAFIVFGAAAVVSASTPRSLSFAGGLMLAFSIPAYYLVSVRRVFGLSWPSSALRSLGAGALYLLFFIVAEVVLVAATLSTL
jgi:hypothetical protein